jgi:murein DD-endopeptidase
MKIVEGKITSPFGYRIHPITGIRTLHNGIDIACPVGTAVHSPLDGEVKEVYDTAAGGKTVIIGDENRRFGFCHLSRVLLPAGSKIKKGDIIALSGNTGKSTGPHLHLTLQVDGTWRGRQWTPGQWIDPSRHVEF